MSGIIVLEDGTVVEGLAFGAKKTVFGELVFNTSMTGYCEALTDPSYKGQILMMTYPLIGNYGVDPSTFESQIIQPMGYVVRENCKVPSHPRSKMSLDQFLLENDIPGIENIDTRKLTIKIRVFGTMKAALSTDGWDVKELVDKVKAMPPPEESNLVELVSCDKAIHHKGADGNRKVVVIDCGVKGSIIRGMSKFCDVIQVPYDTTADEVSSLDPDGVIISNGPGDPAHPMVLEKTAKTIRGLIGEYPMMGICLGHQILSLALGGKTYKMKFGHRGVNQPVKNIEENRVYITSQNHGFAVKDVPSELEVTELNVNDSTVEAIRHVELPVFSVQYHPEASPGPHDTRHLFNRFNSLLRGHGNA
jgi:carbamoyl-phosphate synthase small subunit